LLTASLISFGVIAETRRIDAPVARRLKPRQTAPFLAKLKKWRNQWPKLTNPNNPSFPDTARPPTGVVWPIQIDVALHTWRGLQQRSLFCPCRGHRCFFCGPKTGQGCGYRPFIAGTRPAPLPRWKVHS